MFTEKKHVVFVLYCQIQQGKTVLHKVHPSENHAVERLDQFGSDVVVAIPAREVTNPTISGYLERQLPDSTWKR